MDQSKMQKLVNLIRYYILISTTEAGSGHPTSSLSASKVMTTLMFGGFFRADLDNPDNPTNDRLIFSKGHAVPLLYSLYAAAGKVSKDELLTLRKFDSKLEGHPTLNFPYTEVATGSLGQGLGIGVGMALNAKLDGLDYNIYVLMGDGEIAEGSVWEAMEIASYYNLDNLVGIIDANRLGQTGQVMNDHDLVKIEQKVRAFGWNSVRIDGENLQSIFEAFDLAKKSDKPFMIIAKTYKGAGISFLEDKNGWHGKALTRDQLEVALRELGDIDEDLVGVVEKPEILEIQKPLCPSDISPYSSPSKSKISREPEQGRKYVVGDKLATRKAYGQALAELGSENPDVVVLDAETNNSTYSSVFKEAHPKRFFEMFIAEQNMLSTALGFARRGKIPFCSTFGAFLTRAHDQIRMAALSKANIKICGSHCGVSIGPDGSSQMALDDIAMMRSIFDSRVFYPCDAVSADRLVKLVADVEGIVYIRTTRGDTEIIYHPDEVFWVGGSKVLKKSENDLVTVVTAGITVFEALKAHQELQSQESVNIRVIDLYSVKPVDRETLIKAVDETGKIIVVEDHYKEGGLYGAVSEALEGVKAEIYSLAVTKMPRSGKTEELFEYEEIDAKAIVQKVKEIEK